MAEIISLVNMWKIEKWLILIFKKPMTGQGDDYTAGGLLDYPYFNEIVIIAIDLRK